MSGSHGSSPTHDLISKAAGLVAVGGVAWSLYKSFGPKSKLFPSQSYHVVKGDTLFSIAQRNGISVDALKSANGLCEDDIYVGDTIVIPK